MDLDSQWEVLDYNASGTRDMCNISTDIKADTDTDTPSTNVRNVNLGPFTNHYF